MLKHTDTNAWLRSSRYFIEGEDVGRAGGAALDCRYFRGSIAFSEWMAGFIEGGATHSDLTYEIKTCTVSAPNSGRSSSE